MNLRLEEALEEAGYDFDNPTLEFTSPSYDEAVIGYTTDNRIVYDFEKMVQCLMKHDNISWIEAVEFIEYNVLSFHHFGSDMPIIIYPIENPLKLDVEEEFNAE